MSRLDAPLIAALERSHIHPLWDRYKRITPVAPKAMDAPMHWRWRDLEPFTERAAKEVGIEDVERRALILVNPAFGGETVTTEPDTVQSRSAPVVEVAALIGIAPLRPGRTAR